MELQTGATLDAEDAGEDYFEPTGSAGVDAVFRRFKHLFDFCDEAKRIAAADPAEDEDEEDFMALFGGEGNWDAREAASTPAGKAYWAGIDARAEVIAAEMGCCFAGARGRAHAEAVKKRIARLLDR